MPVTKKVKANKAKAKKEEKLQMVDRRTGLLIGPDTRLIISNSDDAAKAVKAGGKLLEKINEIRAESKLGELEADLENIRKSLREYQVDNDVDEVKAGGFVSNLVQRRKSFWVWAPEDIPKNIELEDDVVPLRDVIKRKFRDLKKRQKITNRITARVVIPAALDDLHREGLLDAEETRDSFAEFIDTSYVQIKEVKK